MKPVFYLVLAVVFSDFSYAQSNTDSLEINIQFTFGDPFYDYSHYPDTVLIEYGNCNPGGTIFYPSNEPGQMRFTRRETTIKNGRLKKIMIYDSNSGMQTTYDYSRGNIPQEERIYIQAWNAPHPNGN